MRGSFRGELLLWKGVLLALKTMYDAGSRLRFEVSATGGDECGLNRTRPRNKNSNKIEGVEDAQRSDDVVGVCSNSMA